jgi:hypothetical protein
LSGAPLDLDLQETLEEFKTSLSKAGCLLADTLHAVYDGQHDALLKKAASLTPQASVHALVEDTAKDAGLGELGARLRELSRALATTRAIATTADQAGPPASLRTLARRRSGQNDEEVQKDEEERKAVWQKTQALRRRSVTLDCVRTNTVEGWQAAWRKCGAVRNFTGQLKETHRAFLLSADLITEVKDQPWSHITHSGGQLKPMLEFLLTMEGPTDFLLLFDGRSREARRAIEGATEKRPHGCEAWIVFAGKTNRVREDSAMRSRKVLFGSKNMEMGLVFAPAPRTRLKCKERTTFAACGESSTHEATYTGVAFRPLHALPRISPEDKVKVFPELANAEIVPANWDDASGIPLFWQESKDVEFWKTSLQTWTSPPSST